VKSPTQNDFQLKVSVDSLLTINLSSTGSGTHTAIYDAVIEEPSTEQRIRALEVNGNFYVTSKTGIKKISALSPYAISDAGGIRALDLNLSLDYTTTVGFLDPLKEVSYRMTWITTDINGNLIEGVPSYPATIYNPSDSTRNVFVQFIVPSTITTDYSYRIYRTSQADLGGSGDECKQVYEDRFDPSASVYNSSTRTITILDEQFDALRDSGTILYTNEFSGEGAAQANYAPPIAKDIASYQNYTFYANTQSNYQYTFTLLGQDGLSSLTNSTISSIVFSSGVSTFTFTSAHGLSATQKIALVGTVNSMDNTYTATYINTVKFSLPGDFTAIGTKWSIFTSYVTINKSTSSHNYYFVGRSDINKITVGSNGATVGGNYFNINSYDNQIPYYVWFNDTTAGTPSTDPNITNRIGLKVDYIGTGGSPDSTTAIALKIGQVLDATGDFRCTPSGADVTIETANNGYATNPTLTGLAGWTVTNLQEGFGEDSAKNYIRLSGLSSPAARIEDTAKSLCSVINRNVNEIVIANYISGTSELPGTVFLENKLVDNTSFSIIANNPTTGSMFNANLTTEQTASNESFPNRIYYSKFLQPEAVPKFNSVDVGPKDKRILRILGLRDSLFIFKEDAIYRLTGYSPASFQVILTDSSSNLVAPDSASILNNMIYALTAQGVATISESGVGVISRPIENILNKITSPAFVNYKKQCFGFGYEGDRSYILFTPFDPEDINATVAYRYNTFTQSWTSWEKEATCGLVEAGTNKIFLGAGDIDAIEVERKALTSKDYTDRQYDRLLTAYNNGFSLDNASQFSVGDAVVQTQYLSYVDFNRFVSKAKLDPSLLLSQSFSEISVGQNLRDRMNELVAELNVKDTSLKVVNLSDMDVDLLNNRINSNSHGLVNDDAVKFTGASLPNPLNSTSYFFVTNATTNNFQLTDENGTLITFTTIGSGSFTVSELYYTSNVEDFQQIQLDFNYNIDKINLSTGAFFNNYKQSEDTYEVGFLVVGVAKSVNKVTSNTTPVLFKGPVTHYKGITTNVVYSPIALGDPSITKHIRSGTLMVENYTLHNATVGYASDLSGAFEDIDFVLSGGTNWGDSIFGSVAWGGEGLAIPLRTLIPRNKQRCRYIKARFQHVNAFEKFSILGISYTFEPVSDRGYR
jgi:hypothetical protein